MTAISASFPAYRASDVAFRVSVPTAQLTDGMRDLSINELEFIAGGWPKWVDSLGKAMVAGFCVGMAALVGMVNPIGGAMFGSALAEFVFNEW